MNDPRHLSPQQLSEALTAARQATLDACLDLSDQQWWVPFDPAIQPTAWDLTHVAWFAEFWLLRGPHGVRPDGTASATRPSRFAGPDEHYDSAVIQHADRWRIPLRRRADLMADLEGQLDACRALIADRGDDPDVRYFAQLSLYHELMHVEALCWTRALLAYAPPRGAVMPKIGSAERIEIAGGQLLLGSDAAERFAFDNEQPPCQVQLAPFLIDSLPVRNGSFLEFVEDDGYSRREFWPGEAGRWRDRTDRTLPERWRRGEQGRIEHRWYDSWTPLPVDQPIAHVNAYEAEAYCRWAGARLPTAAEWEAAAPHMRWGHMVWEWTASTFAPYAGFRPGPYTTYSAPWFHHQRELRGGAYTTHALMHDRRYRNFFLPWRTDIFGGFRTAVDA